MRLLPRFVRVLFASGYLQPTKKGTTMLSELKQKAAEAAKAIVAAATPIVTAFVVDAMADLSVWGVGVIAAGATAFMVWLVPNRPPA